VMGAVGLVAAVFFVKLVHSPLTHPAVNKAEVDFIEAGGGLVQVLMTCKGDVRSLKISPEIVNPADVETLEDLVMAAVNMARQNADSTMASETARMMDSMGLPSNFELPKF